MSARIDRLHSRYNQLLNASMERIEVFATAIRVSDELVDLVEQLEDFMDACDDALGTLGKLIFPHFKNSCNLRRLRN
jgi:hypothetical protein